MNNSSLQTETPITTNEMSLGKWLITMLLISIPIVNIVMLCIWGFGENDPRKNFSRAYLIWIGIVFVLSMIGWIFFAIIIASLGGAFTINMSQKVAFPGK